MDEITKIIREIEKAETADFRELVKISGLDPSKDFKFMDLCGVDFTGTDLEGFNFHGSKLYGANFTESLITCAIFDAPQRGLPELRAAEDYNNAAKAWKDQSNNRKTHGPASREWHSIWDKGEVPEWVDEYGTDSYGCWASITYQGIVQVFRYCQPGRFLIGSPSDEVGHQSNEDPQQEITFLSGFWLSDTAVTYELYHALMESHTQPRQVPSKPMDHVSWKDVSRFTANLSGEVRDLTCRLPSESEWEYACRAGTVEPFNPSVGRTYNGQSVTVTEVNYRGEFPYGSAPIGIYREQSVAAKGGEFRPNNWGLWHMHGNIAEWCQDTWSDNHVGINSDGTARNTLRIDTRDVSRVLRGGSWMNDAKSSRSARRYALHPGSNHSAIGFRIAISNGKNSSE